MKQYVGTKTLFAKPMTLGEYNKHRNWSIPSNEDPNTEGYLVKYPDAYESWSPKFVFEKSYRSNGNFNFGHALHLIEHGARVSRSGWNGKNMFIFKVPGSVFKVNREPLLSILGEDTKVYYHGHIDMRTADGTIVPWICSQTDMQSNDWGIVPNA